VAFEDRGDAEVRGCFRAGLGAALLAARLVDTRGAFRAGLAVLDGEAGRFVLVREVEVFPTRASSSSESESFRPQIIYGPARLRGK
jgi:hypothetical protein